MIQRIWAALLGVIILATTVLAGEVTFKGSDRFLFDVDGNHISAYALKIYCKLTFHNKSPLHAVVHG